MRETLTTIALLWLTFSSVVHGTTFKAELVGEQLRFKNAYTLDGSHIVPSNWSVVSNLPTTEKWVPGGLLSVAPATLKLQSGSDSVDVPFNIVGFEYNTGSAGPTIGDSQSGNICNNESFTNGIATVTDGVACTLSHALVHTSSVNPYSFIRPVVEVDPLDVAQAFEGKPQGRYLGSISVANFFDYYFHSSNNVRTRHVSNNHIALEIDYIPAYITSVDITGDEEMFVRYEFGNNTVSGEATFQGVAQGQFVNGLKVSLLPSRVDYFLNGQGSTFIPYGIDCLGCEWSRLVENGVVVKDTTKIPSSNVNRIDFAIRVFFDNADLDNLETSKYDDAFVLMFEPDV
ncbi:hypothetical protein ACT0HV_000571 [Vibrio diabolicus]